MIDRQVIPTDYPVQRYGVLNCHTILSSLLNTWPEMDPHAHMTVPQRATPENSVLMRWTYQDPFDHWGQTMLCLDSTWMGNHPNDKYTRCCLTVFPHLVACHDVREDTSYLACLSEIMQNTSRTSRCPYRAICHHFWFFVRSWQIMYIIYIAVHVSHLKKIKLSQCHTVQLSNMSHFVFVSSHVSWVFLRTIRWLIGPYFNKVRVRWEGQKLLSRPLADSFAVGQRQKRATQCDTHTPSLTDSV
jgi:hypothetical protein